jgi:hypothetical protein
LETIGMGVVIKKPWVGISFPLRACLGISGMKGNEGHWGGEISIISQNFSKSPSILFHPLKSSISQTSPQVLTNYSRYVLAVLGS